MCCRRWISILGICSRTETIQSVQLFACDVNNNRDRAVQHTNPVRNSFLVRTCALITVLTEYRFWFLYCSSWIPSTVNFSTAPRLYSSHLQDAVTRLRRAVADLSARNADFNTTLVHVGFMVNDVALGGQVFVRVLILPCQCHSTNMIRYDMIYFINCSWVAIQWQFSTHLHTNNTQKDTKQTIHRTTQKLRKSAGRVPSLRVLTWHLPYNWGKSTEKSQSG
jgi:hypothetical protein